MNWHHAIKLIEKFIDLSNPCDTLNKEILQRVPHLDPNNNGNSVKSNNKFQSLPKFDKSN